jgi:hypothetical protein
MIKLDTAMKKIFFVAFVTLVYGCANKDASSDNSGTTSPEEPVQLNISVLLDLSDRVIKEMQPTQSERDIEIVSTLIDIFKENMKKKGANQSKDKMQILFDPVPTDANINTIAKQLRVDLSNDTLDNKQKKKAYDNIKHDFRQGLQEIYDLTKQTKNWQGSDIWRFFKFDAKGLCIEKNYRNILVIITDGYLYHEQSLDRLKNRTAFITPVYLQKEGFRNNPGWLSKFNEQDYGLIPSDQTYEDLEVMVLEVNPPSHHKDDEYIIRAFLEKWFKEMKMKNAVIHGTHLPRDTEKLIKNFFFGTVKAQPVK